MKRALPRTRGFSLIETLVALAIAAVVMSGFYGALATGALLDQRANAQAARFFVATQVLDRVGVDIPLRLGTVDNGVLSGLSWELRITNTPTDEMRLGEIYANELLFISVAVTDPGNADAPAVLRAVRYVQTPL